MTIEAIYDKCFPDFHVSRAYDRIIQFYHLKITVCIIFIEEGGKLRPNLSIFNLGCHVIAAPF